MQVIEHLRLMCESQADQNMTPENSFAIMISNSSNVPIFPDFQKAGSMCEGSSSTAVLLVQEQINTIDENRSKTTNQISEHISVE